MQYQYHFITPRVQPNKYFRHLKETVMIPTLEIPRQPVSRRRSLPRLPDIHHSGDLRVQSNYLRETCLECLINILFNNFQTPSVLRDRGQVTTSVTWALLPHKSCLGISYILVLPNVISAVVCGFLQ